MWHLQNASHRSWPFKTSCLLKDHSMSDHLVDTKHYRGKTFSTWITKLYFNSQCVFLGWIFSYVNFYLPLYLSVFNFLLILVIMFSYVQDSTLKIVVCRKNLTKKCYNSKILSFMRSWRRNMLKKRNSKHAWPSWIDFVTMIGTSYLPWMWHGIRYSKEFQFSPLV